MTNRTILVGGIDPTTGIPVHGIWNTGDKAVAPDGSSLYPIPQTDVFYVDGTVGNDSTATGNIDAPFATIQACLNFIGQPVTMEDSMRHISIHIADVHSAGIGNNSGANQSWDGVYKENLVVPARMITMYGNLAGRI